MNFAMFLKERQYLHIVCWEGTNTWVHHFKPTNEGEITVGLIGLALIFDAPNFDLGLTKSLIFSEFLKVLHSLW